MTKSTQTDLGSFFKGVPKNPQTKMDTFFGKKKSNNNDQEEKENNGNKRTLAKKDEEDEEDQQFKATSSRTTTTNNNNNNNDQSSSKKAAKKPKVDPKRLRRVIDDGDSSDEEMEDKKVAANASGPAKKFKQEEETSEGDDNDSMEVDVENEKPKATVTARIKKEPTIKTESETSTSGAAPGKTASIKKESNVKTESEESEDDSEAAPEKPKATEPAKIKKESNIKTESKPSSFFDKRGAKSSKETKKSDTTKAGASKAAAAADPDASSSSVDLLYADVCEAFEKIEAITGRLEIQQIMTELFRAQITSSKPENLYPLMYLCSNTVAPAYECVELGIGDSILIKSIAEAYGTHVNSVKAKYDDLGDLGSAAQSFKGKQKTLGGFFTAKAKAKPLTCQEILSTFREIAEMKGNQSQKLKTEKIKKMLVRATHTAEPKYIARALQGKLRIGLAQSTVLISLAHALHLSTPPKVEERIAENAKNKVSTDDYPEEARVYMDKKQPKEKRLEAAVAIVKKAYSEGSSYDALLDAALKFPLEEMHQACTLTPGIPVAPMLAKPTKSILEVLKRLNGQRFTCEYKYDGERAQIHILPDGTAKVFSRNLLNTSEKYPEVWAFVKEAAKDNVESCVLDAEVVAYDVKKEKLVPFQVLSTRKKTEESAETAKVQVIVQAFDLMYLNGKSLLSNTLQERRDLMHKNFSVVPGKFTFAVSLDHEENGDTTVIEEFLDQAVKGQCEGLMVKTLDVNAIYEPSRRSLNWLKLKKDYLEGLGDSVDLVPIGAYHGRGKRTGVYGAYLLACYDPDTEEFQSVCKIGTGFSDEALKSLSATLNEHIIPQKTSQYNVSDVLECNVWFDAVSVWEVKAADLSKSSAHRGAAGKTGEHGRGIGLRFPRFERLREDKRPDQATSSDQILDMYYNQDSVGGKGGDGDTGDADDDGI